MLHCKFCKVDVAGSHEHCPLCGGNLTGEPDAERTYPPALPKSDFAKRFLQIATVVAACAGVICVAVNLLVTPQVWWSLYTLLGIACGWLWLTIGLLKKSNIKKSIAWQLIVISLLVLLWDAVTGWHGVVYRLCLSFYLYLCAAGGHGADPHSAYAGARLYYICDHGRCFGCHSGHFYFDRYPACLDSLGHLCSG